MKLCLPFWHKKNLQLSMQELTSDELHQLLREGDFAKLKPYLDSASILKQTFTTARYTILHILAGFNNRKHIDILGYVLFKQKDIITEFYLNRTETNSLLTACHIAALEGNPEALRMLVQYGANPTLATNLECGTALALASKYRDRYDDNVFNSIKEIIENYSKIYQAANASGETETSEMTTTVRNRKRYPFLQQKPVTKADIELTTSLLQNTDPFAPANTINRLLPKQITPH